MTPFFAESWVYSTCKSIISHCEELLIEQTPSPAYQAAKAELMHLARMQLDTLGYVAEFIPFSVCTSPTIMRAHGDRLNGAGGSESGRERIEKITNEELKGSLGSKEEFDALYKVFLGYLWIRKLQRVRSMHSGSLNAQDSPGRYKATSHTYTFSAMSSKTQ